MVKPSRKNWIVVAALASIAALPLLLSACIPEADDPKKLTFQGETDDGSGGGDTGGTGDTGGGGDGAVACFPACTITDATATVIVGAAGGIVTFSPGGDTTNTV
ncbi:MAG: hypothetical protein IID61_17775, partial [SAR324 cluster bacterium]|nr:hypothetical protein [SAR324 cluster bacterium]